MKKKHIFKCCDKVMRKNGTRVKWELAHNNTKVPIRIQTFFCPDCGKSKSVKLKSDITDPNKIRKDFKKMLQSLKELTTEIQRISELI